MTEDTQAPLIPCCQCGTIMHVYFQPATDYDEGAYYVTCVNTSCVMWGHTLSANHYPPENLDVYLHPNDKANVVVIYIRLVRQDSIQAAAAIEQIYATIGAKAALRAALIIMIFKMEVKQNHWMPDMNSYAYLIRDFRQAIPLLERAMTCCLQAWDIHDIEFGNLETGDPTGWNDKGFGSVERDQ